MLTYKHADEIAARVRRGELDALPDDILHLIRELHNEQLSAAKYLERRVHWKTEYPAWWFETVHAVRIAKRMGLLDRSGKVSRAGHKVVEQVNRQEKARYRRNFKI